VRPSSPTSSSLYQHQPKEWSKFDPIILEEYAFLDSIFMGNQFTSTLAQYIAFLHGTVI
jgi:hypothetical protein